MKQEAISKINKMGQIGQIFALIAKILIGFGAVVLLVSTILVAFIPQEFVNITAGGTAQVAVDLESIGVSMSEADQKLINSSQTDVTSGSLAANGIEYKVDEMKADEDGLLINASADNITFSLHDIWSVMFIGTLAMIMSFVTLWFIGSLCKAVRYCKTPFEENVIKKMQHLAISLIPWSCFSSISDGMSAGMMYGKPQVNLSVDLGMVLVIVIIFALTYIFKYGAVLQQESDETL